MLSVGTRLSHCLPSPCLGFCNSVFEEGQGKLEQSSHEAHSGGFILVFMHGSAVGGVSRSTKSVHASARTAGYVSLRKGLPAVHSMRAAGFT